MKSVHLPALPSWLVYGILCFGSVYATLDLYPGGFSAAPLWASGGFALAGLLLHGFWALPGVVIGTLLAFQLHHLPPLESGILSAGLVLGSVAVAALLRRQGSAYTLLNNALQSTLFLITAPLLLPLFSIASVLILDALDGGPGERSLLLLSQQIWLSHALGLLLVTPLVLAWRIRAPWPKGLWPRLEALLLLAASGALAYLYVSPDLPDAIHQYPLSYLPFPLLVWAFLRFRARATTLVLLILAIAVLWSSRAGQGPFAAQQAPLQEIMLQLYLLVMSLTALIGISQIGDRQQRLQRMGLANKIITHSPQGIIVTDPGGIILSANPAFFVSTGFQPNEIAGQSIQKLTSVHHNRDFFANIWRQLKLKGQWEGEIWNRDKNGEIHPQWLSLTAITDPAHRPTHYLGIYADVSHQKQVQERLRRLAYHDVLTGLPNRQLFNDRLNQAIKYADRNNARLALFFIDLDRFKNVNDTLGHSVGDKVLQLTAERLNKHTRQTDTLSRLGGDEFTIIIQDITENFDTVRVAEKVIKAFQTPLVIDGQELFMTPSIGIAMFPDDAKTSEELVKYADTAMYRAKELGGNGFQFFAADMSDPVRWSLTIENALRRAVEQQTITLEYQPQFDLRSGDIVGLEALARWQHHGMEETPPEIFIKVAEETGLIHRMGDQIIEMACQQAAQWHREGFNSLKVSINLSLLQLKQSDFSDRLQKIVRDSGAPKEMIELEITETTLMENAGFMESMINMLSVQGFRIAIDDFGTGYSSLSYLKRLSIDRVKIDSSFVKELPDAANDAAICTAIISMAHNLNLSVVAEGVESDEQMEFLRKSHCDEIQGYIFSKPVGPQEISEMIRQGYWHTRSEQEH
ncbi:MAG: EAL domain-containing protein [Gammaproteobacteria bacterium]|nr:EAL domain-containing protein [Gammaproteobacteria bacterium]